MMQHVSKVSSASQEISYACKSIADKASSVVNLSVYPSKGMGK